MVKKKLLIMENSVHYYNVYNYYKTFNKKFNVDFYLAISEDRKIIDRDCPKLLKNKKFKVINAGYQKIFFLRALLLNKYDYYFVSYGIEQQQYYFFFNYILYGLFSILNSNKIIFRIGRSINYFNATLLKKRFRKDPTQKDGLLSLLFKYLRIFFVKKSKFLVFENNTLKSFFKKYTNFPCKHLVIKPTFKNKIYLKKFKYKSPIVLGIHGSIDPRRRDYKYLTGELKKLNNKIKQKIIIKLPGASNFITNKNIDTKISKMQSKIISDLKKTRIKIIYQNQGFVERKKYEKEFQNIDFLIDISKNDGHFFFKPTGLITDAQNFSKRILLKKNNDPYKEYKDLVIYYKNLSGCIKNIVTRRLILKKKIINIQNNEELKKIYS